MTGLLVSVRNCVEARRALDGGARVIDVKEPLAGSLGAASPETIRAVYEAVGGRLPVSAALGELADADALHRCRTLPKCQFAKLGLAGMALKTDWARTWQSALAQLPRAVQPVAVAYADATAALAPPVDDVLPLAVEFGCAGLFIDTWDKSAGRLVDVVSIEQLARWSLAVRQAGLFFVVAGSLHLDDLVNVLPTNPDLVAVRGAVCSGGRDGTLDQNLVRRFAESLAIARLGHSTHTLSTPH